MSDDDSTETPTPEGQDSDLVKHLRAELASRDKALKEERDERLALQREQAFRAAGFDPTSKGPAKLLFESYDGEPDVDAVRAAADEYGLTPAQQQAQTEDDETETPSYSEQERQTMSQMDQATEGNAPSRDLSTPAQAAQAAYEREMNTTGSRREAMAQSFNARMVTALDERKKTRR